MNNIAAPSPAAPDAGESGFEESPLFYGRWNVEEEKYAEALIEEFRDGNLEDADFEDGPNTLRGFLATKLRCAPKRISKKFESSGYNGRMQYVRKKGTMTSEESARRREQLEILHQEFEARRRGLPKKPTKKKQPPRTNSATRSRSAISATGTLHNTLVRDAAMVANAYRSPTTAIAAAAAAGIPPLNLAGGIGSIVPGVGGHRLPTVGPTAAGLGATRASLLASLQNSHRPFVTDDLLLSGRPLISGLAATTATPSLFGGSLGGAGGGSLFQPTSRATTSAADSVWLNSILTSTPAEPPRPSTEAALLSSILSANPAGTPAPSAGNDGSKSLLTKRRLENAALCSMLQRENMNHQAKTLVFQHQLAAQERRRVEGIMATSDYEGTSLVDTAAAFDGPPSKRPRAA